MSKLINDGSAVISLERLRELEKAEADGKALQEAFDDEVAGLNMTLKISSSHYYDRDRTKKFELTKGGTLNLISVEMLQECIKVINEVAKENSAYIKATQESTSALRNKYNRIGFWRRLKLVFAPECYEDLIEIK